MTIKEILQKETKILSDKKIKSASLDAEILLLYALARFKNRTKSFRNDRSWLCAHDDYKLNKKQRGEIFSLVSRRAKYEPIAYITGKKEFLGLNFKINKNVLIPRPETEILVEKALKKIIKKIEKTEAKKETVVADIGTGSGAIAVSTAKILKNAGKIKNIKIYATDISKKALKTAEANAKSLRVEKNITFKRGDLLKALPRNIKVDFLLANLPYVKKNYYYWNYWKKNGGQPAEFHEIKHEPKISVLAENDGLKYFKKFFPQAPLYLAKNAKIFLESDPHQISVIKKLAKKYLPAHKIEIFKDLRGLNRITKIEIY